MKPQQLLRTEREEFLLLKPTRQGRTAIYTRTEGKEGKGLCYRPKERCSNHFKLFLRLRLLMTILPQLKEVELLILI